MKILVDVSLSPWWIPFLEAPGFESVHWSTVGSCADSDSKIFEYAAAHQCVVFTHDLDFGTLLAERKTTVPSVIQVRCQDVLPEPLA